MANEESGTSVDVEDLKKRGKAWGEIEEKLLIREVLQREDSLFGVIRTVGVERNLCTEFVPMLGGKLQTR